MTKQRSHLLHLHDTIYHVLLPFQLHFIFKNIDNTIPRKYLSIFATFKISKLLLLYIFSINILKDIEN